MNNIPQTVAPLVLTTVVPVTASAMANYVGFILYPTNGDIYYGDLAVTTTNGILLSSGMPIQIDTKHPELWGVVASAGTVDVRVTLLSGTR